MYRKVKTDYLKVPGSQANRIAPVANTDWFTRDRVIFIKLLPLAGRAVRAPLNMARRRRCLSKQVHVRLVQLVQLQLAMVAGVLAIGATSSEYD